MEFEDPYRQNTQAVILAGTAKSIVQPKKEREEAIMEYIEVEHRSPSRVMVPCSVLRSKPILYREPID